MAEGSTKYNALGNGWPCGCPCTTDLLKRIGTCQAANSMYVSGAGQVESALLVANNLYFAEHSRRLAPAQWNQRVASDVERGLLEQRLAGWLMRWL